MQVPLPEKVPVALVALIVASATVPEVNVQRELKVVSVCVAPTMNATSVHVPVQLGLMVALPTVVLAILIAVMSQVVAVLGMAAATSTSPAVPVEPAAHWAL